MLDEKKYTKVAILRKHQENIGEEVCKPIPWQKIRKQYPMFEDYGIAAGLYQLWDNVETPFVYLVYDGCCAKYKDKEVEALEGGETAAVIARTYVGDSLGVHHRTNFYGDDFCTLLEFLRQTNIACYQFVVKDLLLTPELYLVSGLYTTAAFNAACSWLFSLLKQFGGKDRKRFSAKQCQYIEHLIPYLWSFFFRQHGEEYKVLCVPSVQKLEDIQEKCWQYDQEESSKESRERFIRLMNQGKAEEALAWARSIPQDAEDLQDIRSLCINYDRERRFDRYTTLDQTKPWTKLLVKPEKKEHPGICNRSPRVLVFEWPSVGHKTMLDALQSFGFDCDSLRLPFSLGGYDDRCLWQLHHYMQDKTYDFVFSINFQKLVADVCDYYQIPYIAWCYDAPTFHGAGKQVYYPTTHIFLFDSDDAKNYELAGVKQAHYLPLAVNLPYFERELARTEVGNQYEAEISFIGTLYQSNLPKAMQSLTDYQKGYLNAVMDQQIDVYGHSFLPNVLTNDFIDWLDNPEFNRYVNAEFNKYSERTWEETKDTKPTAGSVQVTLNRQITNKERILLLNLLAKHYQVNLYTYEHNDALQGQKFCGRADYYTEMPHVFRGSKFNLNASLRSIQHGIPLRCLDVMGCHGLLLTNYQKDFDEHFVDEKNLLFYTDAKEALEKVQFYMAHETKRQKIVEAGYETVKRFYSYPVKLRELFRLADLEYLLPEKERKSL